jgi:glycolate oxidase FAD binding subunit
MLDFGLPPARSGIALDTTRIDRIIDYPSRDMTITVEAGIRVAKLQEMLRAERQRLPVDVPRSDEATLGGAIATNTSGPRRYGFGTLRDYVIGISVVDAAGKETQAGGRVVKNVAGYDLCKLYTGSLGTLGVITQVTLKLRPAPETSAVVWLNLDKDDAVAAALDRLASSRTRPSAIELLNPVAADHVVHSIGWPLPDRPWVIVVGFEENAEAVRWQQDQLVSEVKELAASREQFAGAEAMAIWTALVEFQLCQPNQLSFKANIRSSATLELLDAVRRQPIPWAVQAHAGNGIAHGHLTHDVEFNAIERSLTELRSLALARQGNLVLRRCPTEWKNRLPIWGEPRPDAWLMRAVQHKLDPTGLWNPGRFLNPQ